MSNNRFKFVGAVAVLLEKEGQVLLMRRANTGFADGMWSLPTGHIDGGESFAQAACREAKEEIGVDIVPDDMEFFHLSQHKYGTAHECITFFFRAKDWQGEPVNNEPDKCDDVRWFKKDELPDNLLLGMYDALLNSALPVSLQTYSLKTGETMDVLTKKQQQKGRQGPKTP